MWLDLLVISTLWVGAVIGMLASQSKKPEHRANGAQATRNPKSV